MLKLDSATTNGRHTRTDKKRYSVPAIDKAVGVLALLAGSERGKHLGFVIMNGADRYELSLLLFEWRTSIHPSNA